MQGFIHSFLEKIFHGDTLLMLQREEKTNKQFSQVDR